jgi:hypothetical protein
MPSDPRATGTATRFLVAALAPAVSGTLARGGGGGEDEAVAAEGGTCRPVSWPYQPTRERGLACQQAAVRGIAAWDGLPVPLPNGATIRSEP